MTISFRENSQTHQPVPPRLSQTIKGLGGANRSLSGIFPRKVTKFTKYKSLEQFRNSKTFRKALEKLSEAEQKEVLEKIEKISASMEKEFDYFHLLPFNKFSDYTKKQKQISEKLKSDDLPPLEKLTTKAEYIALSELIDKINDPDYKEPGYCIRAQKEGLERILKETGLMKKTETINTPKAIDQMIDFYLNETLSLNPNQTSVSHIYASCAAMALRFNRQKDPLSQKMAKHMSFLEHIATYQFEGDTDKEQEEVYKKQIHKMLDEDGFAFIPLWTLNGLPNQSSHAMYGVLKRNNMGGIDLHLQNTTGKLTTSNRTSSYMKVGQKKVTAELCGNNDNERLDNIMHLCRQRSGKNTNIDDTSSNKSSIEQIYYPPTALNKNPLYFKDIFQNIEESDKRLNWYQIKGNCHIAGLHCALALAARLNAETPDNSGMPKIQGLNPETMAKDVQKLQYADEANAYYQVIYKLRRNAKRKKAERALQEKVTIEEPVPTE